MTLESFKMEANFPDVKEKLTRSARGIEISSRTSLRTLLGILLEPELLEVDMDQIILATSSRETGDKNIEFVLDCPR